MPRSLSFILAIGLVVSMTSCRKDKYRYDQTPYNLEIPEHFGPMSVPADNPMTVEGVELGRMLFWEKKLSGDNSMSCGTCHIPDKGFSDPDQFSTGIDGIQGNRNSMALVNLGWQNFFFWDGRAATLEDQILGPVPNPIEMHQSWPDAVAKLEMDPEYPDLFARAFGTEGIDSIRVSKAIAQFLRTMISADSKFDAYYKSTHGYALTAEEQARLAQVTPDEVAGFDLFNSQAGGDCFHCHGGPLTQKNRLSNNGLDMTFADDGHMLVTGDPADRGKFKVPTLRNIALTAPYMHDGRFQTLDEVINHYSFGVVNSPTIDPLMEFAFQGGVDLSFSERQQLKAYLLMLTDSTFINNPAFQDPFN